MVEVEYGETYVVIFGWYLEYNMEILTELI